MITPFTFKGKIGRGRYAAWSAGLFLGGQLLVWAVFGDGNEFLRQSGRNYVVAILGIAYVLLMVWAFAALAFRRAADANLGCWIAGLAVLPVIQIPVIICLCLAPSQPRTIAGYAGTPTPSSILVAAVLGALAGGGLTLVAVATGTLGFGTYGYGLFLLTPFMVGATAAYVANYKADIGVPGTTWSIMIAVLLGSLGLVAVPLEGLICIIMAAPLGLGMALIGGAVGREMALRGRRPAAQTLSCLALLPLMFAVENVLPPVAHFETHQTIAVAAPPDAVWESILSTDPVEGPLALPFRLGVAYPLRGEVLGEGIGAVRYGEFSTGTAIERMTEWVPNRKLAFVVVRDIPGMRELSPYEHVYAPHVIGYFRTLSTSFELVPRSDGGTDIVERTSHELRLDPVPYWLPMAQWIVRQNNARVLAHIRTHAERGLRRLSSASPSSR